MRRTKPPASVSTKDTPPKRVKTAPRQVSSEPQAPKPTAPSPKQKPRSLLGFERYLAERLQGVRSKDADAVNFEEQIEKDWLDMPEAIRKIYAEEANSSVKPQSVSHTYTLPSKRGPESAIPAQFAKKRPAG